MLYTHDGHSPTLDPNAYLAPNAALVGDVTVEAGARILHGAQVISEGGPIRIGPGTIVMQNAVLRAIPDAPLTIGEACLVGPQAHVTSCTLEREVFVATGAAIFHRAVLEEGSEVRVHGVVHVGSRLTAGTTVPIGWIAVGDPAKVLPPEKHDEIWEIQQGLHFPKVAYGLSRDEASVAAITERMAERLDSHRGDSAVE